MTLSEIINSILQKLDDNSLYSPQAEIVTSGINPAMRLLAMSRARLTRRVTATVSAEAITVDLRQVAPRLLRLRRVVLGTITGDSPTVSGSEYHRLDEARLQSIAWEHDWFIKRGRVTKYWRFGQHWLGLHKRPTVDTTITLIFDAIPLAFTEAQITEQPQASPELADTAHPLIADVGYALLLIKEGAVESARAEQVLQLVFGQEITRGLRRVLRNLEQPVG